MILDETQIKQMMVDVLPDIKAGLVKQFTDSSNWEIQSKLRALVSEQVKEFYEVEISPELYKQLVENKDSIIAIGVKMGGEMSDLLSVAIMKKLKENLETSYERDKILKALIGVY